MKNPNIPIRQAIISLLSGGSVPAYYMQVPKSVTPNPSTYILLTTQTKKQVNTSKCGHDWQCSILFDIVDQQLQGFISGVTVDNIEQNISDALDLQNGDISLTGFTIYNTQIQDSHDIILDTKTHTINRRLVRYQFIVSGEY